MFNWITLFQDGSMRAEIVGINGRMVDMIWRAEAKRFMAVWYTKYLMGIIVFQEKIIEYAGKFAPANEETFLPDLAATGHSRK